MNNRKNKVRIALIIAMMVTLVFSTGSSVFAEIISSDNNDEVRATASNAVATSVNGENKKTADGTYKTDNFGWSGGSGRLAYIRCDQVEVVNGQVFGTIEFGSESYDSVKVDGRTYERTNKEGNSEFRIPVKVNANTHISGRTTAMSQAHWIDYDIYVRIADFDGSDKAGDKTRLGKKSFRKKIPEIMGLEPVKKIKTGKAEYLRLYEYQQNIKLLQVDMGTKSVLAYQDNDSLYHQNIVSYILIPEGVQLPAGIEKEAIVVRVPAASVCRDADIDYAELVKNKTDLVVLPADSIKAFIFGKQKKIDKIEEIEESCMTLDIPVIVNRADSEKGSEAKAGWDKAFNALGIADSE